MRVFLYANKIVGLEVAKFLLECGDEIVGLGLCDDTREEYAEDIRRVCKNTNAVFYGKQAVDPDFVMESVLKSEIIISAFWMHIIPKDILKERTAINFHPAYLPFNRGMHPNVWGLIENTMDGVTIHYIGDKVDEGDIIARQEIWRTDIDTAGTLYEKAKVAIVDLFKKYWEPLKIGIAPRIPQDELGFGTKHMAKDIEKVDKLDIDDVTGPFLNQLKARSYADRSYAYYENPVSHKKVYVKVSLSYEPNF